MCCLGSAHPARLSSRHLVKVQWVDLKGPVRLAVSCQDVSSCALPRRKSRRGAVKLRDGGGVSLFPLPGIVPPLSQRQAHYFDRPEWVPEFKVWGSYKGPRRQLHRLLHMLPVAAALSKHSRLISKIQGHKDRPQKVGLL